MESLRDAIKSRYSKPCCIKVGVAVGVVLLLLVVVVVAATVAGGGEGGEEEGGKGGGAATNKANPANPGGGGGGGGGGGITKPTEPPAPEPMDWPHQFAVQLESQGFSQILAIDDVTQRYVIEINRNEHFNLYIIVDFPKRQHYYVIMEKGENSGITNVVEKSVLYCESSPFASDFNGLFTSSSTLRDGGKTYREQISGRTATLDADYVNAPYTVSATLVAVLNGSCAALMKDQLFEWNSKVSKVCGDNTTLPSDSPACSNNPCPKFPTTALSTGQACTNFRKCNYVMAKCDSTWATPYNKRPYCVCRKTIIDDVDNINCPPVTDDDGECEIPKRDIKTFEGSAPCYCRYRISRIYPKTIPTNVQTISWEIKASIITAPAKNHMQCSC